MSLPSPNIPSIYQLRRDSKPSVAAIDTATNEVIATYEWWDSVVTTMHGAARLENSFFATGDGIHLIAHTEGFSQFHVRPIWQLINIFSGRSAAPTAAVDPQGRVTTMFFSRDEKLLVLVGEKNDAPSGLLDIVNLGTGNVVRTDPGGKITATMLSKAGASLPGGSGSSLVVAVEKTGQLSGVLDVVDLASGKITSHSLPDQPTKLIRLGSTQGIWVLGEHEMRSVSESGEPGDKPIPLNDKVSGDAFLNGFPGETIGLGEEHAAILITDKGGASRHQVALLDLKQLKVDNIIETMSAGEQAKIRGGRLAKYLAIGLVLPADAGLFYPNGLGNESLAARPDGRFLYVLDTDTHDVTVVGVDTAAIAERIPVDKSVTRLLVLPDGKRLSCVGRITQYIDLGSNKMEN